VRTLLASCCAAGVAAAAAGGAGPGTGRIVFASDRAAYLVRPQLVLLAPRGGLRRIVLTASRRVAVGTPVWSPGGDRVALRIGSGVTIASVRGRRLRRFAGRPAADPAWSPDGRYVAVTADVGGSRLLRVFRVADGRRVLRLAVGPTDLASTWGGTAWSPDGTRLAVGTVNPRSEIARGSLLLVSLATHRTTPLLHPALGYVFEPDWSPDGRSIAFTLVDQSVGSCEPTELGDDVSVRVVDVATRRTRTVARCGWHPAWSPDGRSLAVVNERTVTVVDARTGRGRPVGEGSSVSWSPDSARIAVSDRGAVYVIRVAVRRRHTVAAEEPVRELLAGPSFSPDGKQLAIVDQPRHEYDDLDLYTVSPEGRGVRLLVRGAGSYRGPRWSPDRSRLAFLRGDQVIVADADGRHGQAFGPASSEAWSPDGQRLAVSRADGVHVLDLASHGDELVVPGAGGPAWSRQGRLAWSRDGELWTSAADGSAQLRVAVPRPDQQCTTSAVGGPAWSPDGHRLAYVHETGWTAACSSQGISDEIRVVSADGSGDRLLTRGDSGGPNGVGADEPVWSPDGTRILFVNESETSVTLKIVDADGRHEHTILSGSGSIQDPDWR
jgi:Tol biopolymer transport system component